jgi:leucyl-tRNA synthetase
MKATGHIDMKEPFAGMFTQGMVVHETYQKPDGSFVTPAEVRIETDGAHRRAFLLTTGQEVSIGAIEKMSKSKKNTVAPEEIFDVYGVDAARLFVLSDSPPERDTQWSTSGVQGAWRFVNRVWDEFDAHPIGGIDPPNIEDDHIAAAHELRRMSHRTIKAVTEAIEGFRFNSAIARLYEFLNILKASPALEGDPVMLASRADALLAFARLIAPFTPHLAEECWARMGGEGMVVEAPWPEYDPALTEDAVKTLPVQVNGKRRGEISAPAGAEQAEVEQILRDDPEIAKRLEGLTIRKIIVVKDRIVNIVAA